MILMCKNISVYDIDEDKVLNRNLLPGYMIKGNFKYWLKKRYCSGTNTLARQLRGITFGQGNRIEINKTTRALSLSDCYWLKESSEDLNFEDISPYYTNFWKGAGEYIGNSIPTLYVPGFISKAWINHEWLFKSKCEIEVECSSICNKVGVPCAEIHSGIGGILVKNITNTELMLEQADMSGRFDEEEYTDEDIIREFGLDGYKMILIDAIFGNGDRHLGNFGWLRNTDTGEYVSMSPLYDFDHALDAKGSEDILIRNIIKWSNYKEVAKEIIDRIVNIECSDIFKRRAESIRRGL